MVCFECPFFQPRVTNAHHPSPELVKEEYLQLKLQQEIAKEVEDKISKTRRTAMLHEQLNVIKKELGLSKGARLGACTCCLQWNLMGAPPDDKEALVEKFTARLSALTLPETTKVWRIFRFSGFFSHPKMQPGIADGD